MLPRWALPIYLVATFGLAWLLWLLVILSDCAFITLPLPPVSLLFIGTFAPSLVALAIAIS